MPSTRTLARFTALDMSEPGSMITVTMPTPSRASLRSSLMPTISRTRFLDTQDDAALHLLR
jgi:hypothetical protein